MRGKLTTNGIAAGAAALALMAAGDVLAQAELEEIVVTAQRREQRLQDVPISVTTVRPEKLQTILASGEDIRALATRVPSLYAESSNGRAAPRFYIRGLGNTDFDLAASQSVSVIFDEVVQENVILKSFPLFDIAAVEVLRGPQGSLFGRNTPAGIVKFDTRKPTEELDGYGNVTAGSRGTLNFEGAVGGTIIEDFLTGRISVLRQERGDWIDNGFTGENDAMGGFEETAWRAQLMYTPTDRFSALLNLHGRSLDGTSSIFRANIIGPGNNRLNGNFDRDTVFFDEGDNNQQEYDGLGGSLRVNVELSDTVTLTSITAHEQTDGSSLGDIDGGFGAVFLPGGGGPGTIPFPSVTQDGIDNLDQFTQEFRVAGTEDGWNWQAGLFYFDSEFSITTNPFFVPATTVSHSNESWAVFGQASIDLTDAMVLTAGIRYTDDEKDFTSAGVTPVSVSDEDVSGDISLMYTVNDDLNVYGRLARGFRAPTIQGRDVAFGASPSTADSETITSIEGGFKSTLADRRVRLNGSAYYFRISDQQLSAIGGGANFVQLVNADKGTGFGYDLDTELLIHDQFTVTAGLSYNDTEIDDSNLTVAPCGTGLCTVRDPLDANGNAIIDGNPFPQAPDWLLNVTARFTQPIGDGELYVFGDYAFQGETQFFLYETAEFFSEDTFELGLRVGYVFGEDGRFEVAAFGRNITDEENLKGGIDFNNLTGFVNEPRIYGVTFSAQF